MKLAIFCILSLFLSGVVFADNAKSAITSVEISPGLFFNEKNSKPFADMAKAQEYANASKLNEVTMRFHLAADQSVCGLDLPAILLGFVYDQDKALFNGQVIGATGNPGLSDRRLSLLQRVYSIPKPLIKCGSKNVFDLF